ncbi:MAG: hypothetical protein IJY20_00315 [Clostridia bacterium]|nr:hypothetical protein [Clostridia bacterium]
MKKDRKMSSSLEEQRQRLSQYKRLLREIKDDRARLAQLSARLLRGAAAGLPELFGFTSEDLEEYQRHIDENLGRCIALAAGLQQYINDIADSETRRLFIYRYVYGYSWQKVAFAMGWYDESVPRKKHNRYLEAHPQFAIPPAHPALEDRLPDIDAALRREALEIGR